jgi:hypothetical protein
MDKKEQIRQALKQHIQNHTGVATVMATVKSVDESSGTCILIDEDELEMFDIRLKPVLTDDESVVMLPAVGSFVLIARIEADEEWLLIACEKVDKYRITVDESVIEMTSDGIKISKAGESLKSLLSDLIDAIEAITVPTGTGPSGVPINSAQFTAIKNRLTNFLK